MPTTSCRNRNTYMVIWPFIYLAYDKYILGIYLTYDMQGMSWILQAYTLHMLCIWINNVCQSYACHMSAICLAYDQVLHMSAIYLVQTLCVFWYLSRYWIAMAYTRHVAGWLSSNVTGTEQTHKVWTRYMADIRSTLSYAIYMTGIWLPYEIIH